MCQNILFIIFNKTQKEFSTCATSLYAYCKKKSIIIECLYCYNHLQVCLFCFFFLLWQLICKIIEASYYWELFFLIFIIMFE